MEMCSPNWIKATFTVHKLPYYFPSFPADGNGNNVEKDSR